MASQVDPQAAERRKGVRIEARELSRRFGAHLALDRVSLRIEPGEVFGLLGANGAGKTTFIRLATGYLLPSAGEITVDGFSPTADPEAVHSRLGFVAETSRLYPELRVRGFLRFAGGARRMQGARLRRAIEETIERFQLAPVADRVIGNLSKGYQQRVSLAQAFLHDPPLLIVDEPTSGLDPLQRSAVQELLRRLGGDRTIVLCTHDLAEARSLASRVAVLNQGRLTALGTTEAILGGQQPLALFKPGAPAGPGVAA